MIIAVVHSLVFVFGHGLDDALRQKRVDEVALLSIAAIADVHVGRLADLRVGLDEIANLKQSVRSLEF